MPRFADYGEALAAVKPDVVSINTWPDTHADFAIRAFEAGAHVFIEKPLAETAEDAQRVVDTAHRLNRKLVVGYALRHHPSWIRLVEIAKTLGKPLVMRMNLNQQSIGPAWTWHKNLLKSLSPIVDCGVHYVDVMCQMTGARPVRVNGMGARLSDEIAPDMYNYGQLQVFFDDGSVGWYEAAWGPSISETAYFVKDVDRPEGLRLDRHARARRRHGRRARPRPRRPTSTRMARPMRSAGTMPRSIPTSRWSRATR